MVTESESSTDVICDLVLPWKKTFLKKWLNESTFKSSLEGPERSGWTGGRVQGPHLAGTLKEGKWVWVEVKVGSDPITTGKKVEMKEKKRRGWDRGCSPGKQDMERNNLNSSLYASLSSLAKHFQRFHEASPGSKHIWDSIKGRGLTLCLCSTAGERWLNKRKGRKLRQMQSRMEACQILQKQRYNYIWKHTCKINCFILPTMRNVQRPPRSTRGGHKAK